MFCSKCGKELLEGAAFCSGCGAAVSEKEKVTGQAGLSLGQLSPTVPKKDTGKKKSSGLGIVIAAAAVVVVAVAVGLTVYFNSDSYKVGEIIKQASSSYEDGNYKEVQTYAQEVLELDSTREDAYRISSDSYLAEGDCLKALQTLMEGVLNTGSEELIERENYVREHIVVSSEIGYYNGSISYRHEYEYDAAGNQIKWVVYDGDGSIDRREEYEYDAAGNKIKDIRYYGDGSIDWRVEYEYDAAGNIIKYIVYKGDGSINYWNEYEYDAAGNIIKYIRYNGDGSIDWREEYEYDAAGNKIKDIRYNGDVSINSWYENEYDTVGNGIKHIYYSGDVSIGSWYEYDILHNVVKEKHDYTDSIRTYKYTYIFVGEL